MRPNKKPPAWRQGGGRGLHEMNPYLFQSPAGAASTFEPFRIPVLATLYTAPSRSFGVRLVHRERSYGLSWVSPIFRLCLPSPCALIIADRNLFVKGFSIHFANFFASIRDAIGSTVSSACSPVGRGRPDSPPFGWIIPTLVRHCYQPFLGGGAQTQHLPTFRATASCSGGHQIPLESSPFDGLILSYFGGFVKGFLKIFYENFNSYLEALRRQGLR